MSERKIMEQPKHTKKKRAYLDDYHKNNEGKYEYRGKVFTPQVTGKAFSRKKWSMWAVYIPLILCVVGAGCIPAPGLMGTAYVIIPYALGLMGAISFGWGLCRLSTAGEALKSYIYDVTVKKLPHRAVLTIVLNVLAIAAEAVYVLLHGTGSQAIWIAVFAVLEVAVCIFAAVIYRIVRGLVWKCDATEKSPAQMLEEEHAEPASGQNFQEKDTSEEAFKQR